jgi:DNA polymerase III delta prime subunit
MGKVIQFPFRIKYVEQDLRIDKSKPDLLEQIYNDEILKLAKDFLEKEDYDDVVAAISDIEIYKTLDDDLKDVVDAYYDSLK